MTHAENHQSLFDGARSAWERSTQLQIARNDAVAEIQNLDGSLFGLEFVDKSFLQIPEDFKVHA